MLFCTDFLVFISLSHTTVSADQFSCSYFPVRTRMKHVQKLLRKCRQTDSQESEHAFLSSLPFLGAFCGSKGHWGSQERQLKVPDQLPRAPFPFITCSCAQKCS